jgi:hypothetical protein
MLLILFIAKYEIMTYLLLRNTKTNKCLHIIYVSNFQVETLVNIVGLFYIITKFHCFEVQ